MAWPQTSMLGIVEIYGEGGVDVDDGRGDDVEELEKVGGEESAQLEPGPENWVWQVVGSHQAGPISH